jgi:hypothetical protein
MVEMYDSFIAVACTLVVGAGINLCRYLYTRMPVPVTEVESASASASASDSASDPSEHSELLRFTRYHSDNAIKYPNSEPFTTKEKRVCYDFANIMAMLFILKKHTFLCSTLKMYNNVNRTGVFKFENRFIIKYIEFSDTRESTVCNELASRGINHDARIITPIWYSYFENKRRTHKTSPGANEDDAARPNREYSMEVTLYDPADKKNIRVRTRDIISIEIQPVLDRSMVFHKWYTVAQFNPKNHDYVVGTMMLSLARSIKYCHDIGMVHGDIKPDNLLVTHNHPAAGEESDLNWQAKLKVVGRTRDPCDIPNIYLIDFGMCGREGTHDGTGGTRPFCAPEIGNIYTPPPGLQKSCSDTDDYIWRPLSKQHDIWSWALILYTITAYHDVYNVYEDYPSDTFDASGYINETQMDYAFEIKTHPFYPLFEKTLTPPSSRVASIDAIIELLEGILKEM